MCSKGVDVSTNVVSSNTWRGVLDTTLCDTFCQLLTACWVSSPGTSVSSTNKTNPHVKTVILLKVTLNAIHQPNGIDVTNNVLSSVIMVRRTRYNKRDKVSQLLTQAVVFYVIKKIRHVRNKYSLDSIFPTPIDWKFSCVLTCHFLE